jgi:hypothetical protein
MKTLTEVLSGVKASRVRPGSTGTDSATDYQPQSKGDRDFVAKHETEEHEDRVGNKTVPYRYEGKPAKYPRQSRDTYEETERLDEISNDKLKKYIKGAAADMNDAAFDAGYYTKKNPEDPDTKDTARSLPNDVRAQKRLRGILKAVDKLSGSNG